MKNSKAPVAFTLAVRKECRMFRECYRTATVRESVPWLFFSRLLGQSVPCQCFRGFPCSVSGSPCGRFPRIPENAIPLTTSFSYDSSGSGELHQVTFPYGGHIRWAYGPFTYSGSRVLREVSGGRFLSMSAGAAELTYPSTNQYSQAGQLTTTPGPTYTYSFDAMYRPTGLTDQSNNTDVSSVTYNAANQLLGLNYLGTAETRQYNNLNQMTNLTVGSTLNITYTFPAGANNGKISQQAVSGETVTYQYDSLNRLLSASSSQSWGETYGYDGFGNLLSKTPTGSAPTLSQSVNAATNQIVGDLRRERQPTERRLRLRCGESSGDSNGDSVWLRFTEQAGVERRDVGLLGDADSVFLWRGRPAAGNYSFVTPPSESGSPELSDLPKSPGVYFGGKRVGTVTSGVTYSFTQDGWDRTGAIIRMGRRGGRFRRMMWGMRRTRTIRRRGWSTRISDITRVTLEGSCRRIRTATAVAPLYRGAGIAIHTGSGTRRTITTLAGSTPATRSRLTSTPPSAWRTGRLVPCSLGSRARRLRTRTS